LDVSKNTVLEELHCIGNNFSVSELNALFETLHSNDFEDEKIKKIYVNIGTDTCDKSIAEGKGWKFQSYQLDINKPKPVKPNET
jgi:hypothetical protein